MRGSKRENRRPRRILTALAALVLLVALICQSFAAGSEPASVSERPVVTVVAVGVDGGQYLEVGLNVNSNGSSFHVLGVVLQYDPELMTPVQSWDDGAPADLKNTVGWGGTRALPAKGPDELSGKTALATHYEKKTYVYLSAESPVIAPLTQELPAMSEEKMGSWSVAAGAVTEPVKQVVTVRFRLNVAEGGNVAETQKAAVQFIARAGGAVAVTSPVCDRSGMVWLPDASGEALEAQMNYAYIPEGVSVYAPTSGNLMLTLFDWDNEFIGTKVVKKSDDPAQQLKFAETALNEIQAEHAEVFTGQKGSDFGCWIPYASETPTAYGEWVQPTNTGAMSEEDIPRPTDAVEAGDITTDMILKAAYCTNEECTTGSVTQRQYSVVVSDMGRFGGDYTYPVTFRISRGTAPRAIQPALRVEMVSNGITTYSLTELTGVDEEYVTIALSADYESGVDRVVYTVVDIYGQLNWKGCGVRTNTGTTKLQRGTVQREPVGFEGQVIPVFQGDGYPRACIVGNINNVLEAYATGTSKSLTQIGLSQLREIGIACSGISTIRTNLYHAWMSLNTVEGTENGRLKKPTEYVDLTYEQIKQVVQTGSLEAN